jgi:hypothetical protein
MWNSYVRLWLVILLLISSFGYAATVTVSNKYQVVMNCEEKKQGFMSVFVLFA